MEKALERAQIAVEQLDEALVRYSYSRQDLKILAEYLNSEERRSDIEADEAGRLPAELRRGVLSEDTLWNLLEDNAGLIEIMKIIACPDEE